MRLLCKQMAALRNELHTAVELLKQAVIAIQDERASRDPEKFLLQ